MTATEEEHNSNGATHNDSSDIPSDNMGNGSTDYDSSSKAIAWRRAKVLDLSSKGFNQAEIARTLKVSEPTVSRDMDYIRNESREVLEDYYTHRLPTDLRKSFNSIDTILKTGWSIIDKTTTDDKVRIDALRLINTVIMSRVELLGNVNMADRIIDLITDIKVQQQKQKQKQSEGVQ
jgi:Homeodomain-like domain